MSLTKDEEEFVKELYADYRDALLHLKDKVYKKEKCFREIRALDNIGLTSEERTIEKEKIWTKYGVKISSQP